MRRAVPLSACVDFLSTMMWNSGCGSSIGFYVSAVAALDFYWCYIFSSASSAVSCSSSLTRFMRLLVLSLDGTVAGFLYGLEALSSTSYVALMHGASTSESSAREDSASTEGGISLPHGGGISSSFFSLRMTMLFKQCTGLTMASSNT